MSSEQRSGLLVKLPDDSALRCKKEALERGASGDIIELCLKYLDALSDYRGELLKLRGSPGMAPDEITELSRAAVRMAIEEITAAQNTANILLESLTLINGWDAAETFVRSAYLDSTDWEKRGGQVTSDESQKSFSLSDAVEIASRLRSEAYVSDRARTANWTLK